MGDTPQGGDRGAKVTDRPRSRSEVSGQLRALLACTHPRQTLLMAVGIGVAALVAEVLLLEADGLPLVADEDDFVFSGGHDAAD